MIGRIVAPMMKINKAIVARPMIASFHTSNTMLSNFHPLAMHQDTDDNNKDTFFDFTPENFKRVSKYYLALLVLVYIFLIFNVYYFRYGFTNKYNFSTG